MVEQTVSRNPSMQALRWPHCRTNRIQVTSTICEIQQNPNPCLHKPLLPFRLMQAKLLVLSQSIDSWPYFRQAIHRMNNLDHVRQQSLAGVNSKPLPPYNILRQNSCCYRFLRSLIRFDTTHDTNFSLNDFHGSISNLGQLTN